MILFFLLCAGIEFICSSSFYMNLHQDLVQYSVQSMKSNKIYKELPHVSKIFIKRTLSALSNRHHGETAGPSTPYWTSSSIRLRRSYGKKPLLSIALPSGACMVITPPDGNVILYPTLGLLPINPTQQHLPKSPTGCG